jgi:hypothetical protein
MAQYPPGAWESGFSEDWALVAPANWQVLYRLIGDRKPKLRDFQSWRERELATGTGSRYPDDPFIENTSISMFETAELAVRPAKNFPARVAGVVLGRDNGFSLARTDINVDGHYSVWGDPEKLLQAAEGSLSVFESSPWG